MWMYLSLKTSEIKDTKLKEKLGDYYINSSYLSVWDFDIRDFLQKSNDDEYLQVLSLDRLQEVVDEWEKTYRKYDKKINNLFKILSCIVISNYSNQQNETGKENTFESEINKIKSFYKDFLEKSQQYLNYDKDISELFDNYYEEIINIAEYIDNVLERFETSYKNEENIKSEFDYLFWEIYTILRLLNLIKIAKKHDLELVYC